MRFPTLFDSLKPQRSRTPARQQRRGDWRCRPTPCRLAIEALEDRCVPAAVLSVSQAAILEGNAGTQRAEVTVTLSEPHGNAVTVNYRTADGTASAGSDYDAVSGKLTFTKAEMSKTILVSVRDDRVVEADEYFFVQLSNAKGAKITNSQALVTVVDNEPRISITNASGVESHSGPTPFNFTVSLSAPYDLDVTVSYATEDGSAKAGTDYTAVSGSLLIEKGQTSKTIPVLVTGTRVVESDESFYVNVSSPNSYAEVSNGVGVGTIFDAEPRISIGDVWNYGETSFTFTVSLSTVYDEEVTVDFTTVDGTAIAGVDYVASSGSLTFVRNQTTPLTITIEVLAPTYAGWDKYFFVQLSGASTNALIANGWAYGFWYGYYDSYSYYGGGDGYYYYDSYGYDY